jgi:hypothetical protein
MILDDRSARPALVPGGLAGTWFYRKLTVRGFFPFFRPVISFGAVNPLWRGLKDPL